MREFLRTWVDAFHEHQLLTYATAIAMRAFIGSIALAFLGIALLGATGHQDMWKKHIAPAIEPKLTHPTFEAINAAVEKIFASNSTGLIVFAAAYAVWQVSGSMRAVMDALNAIIECEEKRSTLRRFVLSIALAIVVMLLIAMRALRRRSCRAAARRERRRLALADRRAPLARGRDLPRARGRRRRALRAGRAPRRALGERRRGARSSSRG